jgi:WD40 repeat protein
MTFSPEGAFLIAARSTTTPGRPWLIHRWATADALRAGKKRLRPVPGTELAFRYPNGPDGLAISPNGEILATISGDGRRVYRWQCASGTALPEIDLAGQDNSMRFMYDQRVVFSPDNRTLAVAGKSLTLLDAESGILCHTLPKAGTVTGMAFHPSGQRLVTVSGSEEVQVWDVATGKQVIRSRWEAGPLRAVAVSPDGCTAVAGGEEGRLVQWDLDAG